MAALTAQSAFRSINETALLAATPGAPIAGYAGAENLFVTLETGKSVLVTNVTSITIDPPPWSLWNTNYTYAIGDVVLYTDGNLYKALQTAAGHTPDTATAYWVRQPLQYYFDGTSIYRNQTNLPFGGLSGSSSASALVGTTAVIPSPATTQDIYFPGALNGSSKDLLHGMILNDDQAGIPPHATPFIRSRVIFTRTAPGDSSAMATLWYWMDLIQGIGCSKVQ